MSRVVPVRVVEPLRNPDFFPLRADPQARTIACAESRYAPETLYAQARGGTHGDHRVTRVWPWRSARWRGQPFDEAPISGLPD